MDIDLIPPRIPSLSTADVSALADVTSPDTDCVKDIKMGLAGFETNAQDFYA